MAISAKGRYRAATKQKDDNLLRPVNEEVTINISAHTSSERRAAEPRWPWGRRARQSVKWSSERPPVTIGVQRVMDDD